MWKCDRGRHSKLFEREQVNLNKAKTQSSDPCFKLGSNTPIKRQSKENNQD